MLPVREHLRPRPTGQIAHNLPRHLAFTPMYVWTDPPAPGPWRRYANTVGINLIEAEALPLGGQA